jgi:signal transduction histidine kinase
MSASLPSTRMREAELAELFRSAGYDVETVVGDQPGSVVWLATPAHGLLRPRTYFRVLEKAPEDIARALADLESTRVACGADQALGIVQGTSLPPGYTPDLRGRRSNLLTARRWLIELFGAMEGLEATARTLKGRPAHAAYLPRRARLPTGEEVSIDSFLTAWLHDPSRPRLLIAGPEQGGKTTVIEQAVLRSTQQFLADPDTEPLLVDVATFLNPYLAGFTAMGIGVVAISRATDARRNTIARVGPPQIAEQSSEGGPSDAEGATVLELLPPTSEEVMEWFSRTLRDPAASEKMAAARREIPDFAAFSGWLPRLHTMAEVIRQLSPADAELPLDVWTVAVVSLCCEETIHRRQGATERADKSARLLEDAALQEFALGLTALGQRTLYEAILWVPREAHDWFDLEGERFRNVLVRDYFLARKIAREVASGHSEIVLRYQFPRTVFIFLARIAPDIAAGVTQSSVERLEAKVQEEVERKLYLTFAHHLGRPVGRMRTHLNELRDALGREKALAVTRQFQGIHEEIDYIDRLAEKTRLWGVSPEESLTGLALAATVEEVAEPLRQQCPAVEWSIDIDRGVLVQGMSNALRETIQCLLENAFHAALAILPAGDRVPRVEAVAILIGDVVRLEVRDNGPGVKEGDRERIFEPLVTTKKGGRDKPRGTGLGLAIARRYAQHMRGRVGLEASRPETCFYLELVHWKESGDAQP